MTKEEVKMNEAAVRAAKERADKAAGYDIALAYSTLNSLRVNEQLRMDIPLAQVQTDVLAIADIVNRATCGTVDGNALSLLMEVCIAYGWHWCNMGESLLRSKSVLDELLAFCDGRKDVLIDERLRQKEAVTRGLMAVSECVAKQKKVMSLQREMRR